MPTSTTTTVQLCSYNSTTDAYTLILDLNNRSSYYLNTVKWDQQAKVFVRSSNIRTSGERITAVNDPNRHVQVNMWIRNNIGISTNGLLSLLHALENAIEKPPYYLRIAEPGTGTQYSYIQVLAVTHNIPNEPLVIQSQVIKDISIDFECDPYFRGDRLMLSNLVQNPGFEAPSGPAVTVFNDTFANFNAYTASGGAITQDKLTYLDTVLADSPIRYYRLDETSGTVGYDAMGSGYNGTYNNSPTLGVTGGLTGDSDKAVTFTAASFNYMGFDNAHLPLGNASISVEFLFKFSANPASNQFLFDTGASPRINHNNFALLLAPGGQICIDVGAGIILASTALTTGSYQHISATWDGTTARLYVNSNQAGTGATPGTQNVLSNIAAIATTVVASNYFNGQMDEVSIYATALSAARITAHYTAYSTTPAVTSNTMSIPAGASATFNNSFGSAWSAINNWQVRFRYTTGLTANFYAHYITTGSGNYLGVRITGTSMILVKNTASTMTTLATASMTLVPGMQYWLKVTQFPGYLLSASLYTDNAGSANYALVSSLSATSTDTTQGTINITASGATLGIGGNYSQVNTVQLFGPGGWYFKNTGSGTGLAAGSWLTDTTQTYPNGPAQSLGAAVITSAPAGTLDAYWANADDTSPTTIKATAIPFNAPYSGAIVGVYAFGHQLSGSVALNGIILLELWEYTSAGAFNKSTIVQQVAGVYATYVRLQGTVTLDNATAYVVIHLRATDANVETADYAFDNVQLWDTVTTKQTTMPYCELRFPQAPAQLLVSGVVGDVLSPAIVAVGVYETAAANPIIVRLGRRVQSGYLAKLLEWANTSLLGFGNSAKINSSFYGGMYYINTNNTTGYLDYFSVNLAANQGTYHYYANIGITNVTTPTAAAFFLTEFDNQSNYATTAVTPFTANGQQYTVDLGQVSVPLLGYNSLTTLSVLGASFTVTSTNTVGTAGGGSGIFSTSVLMPVDGEIITAKLTTQLSITNTWFYIYSDGITNTLTENRQNSSIPNPYLALVAGSTTGYDAATSIMDTRMNLDPNIATTNNAGTSTYTGVNQFALVVIDSNNAAVPVAVDFYYYPLYRFPR